MAAIFNQGIVDGFNTEPEPISVNRMLAFIEEHGADYPIIVAQQDEILGWAALNRYSPQVSKRGVVDISIYNDRRFRGQGIGKLLLVRLEELAVEYGFHKIIATTYPHNKASRALFERREFRYVGVFEAHASVAGELVDILIFEKILRQTVAQ